MINGKNKNIQELSLRMLKDFKRCCDDLHIVYMLGGGSLLGCIRHNGFIPWDDDIDIMMPRDDYQVFIDKFDNALGEFYYIEVPNSKYKIHGNIMRLYKKGVVAKEDGSPDEINDFCIDIHPIDYCPNNFFIRFVKGFIASAVNLFAASCRLYHNHTKKTKGMYKKGLKRRLDYYIGYSIGFLFSFIDYKEIYNYFDRYIQLKNKTSYMTIAAGRGGGYLGECLSVDTFFPVKRHMFEDVEVNIPNKYDVYLTNLYGDYMRIPKDSERECHNLTTVQVSDDIKWKE